MSVADGTVTDAELRVAQQWFAAKGVDLTCPMCRGKDFTAMAHFVTPIQMVGEFAAPLDGIRYPMFGVSCINCGHVSLFNAIAMGFYAKPQAEADDRPQAEMEGG